MTKIVASYKNVKIECIDSGDYKHHQSSGDIKAILNIFKRSKKRNEGQWRKTQTIIIPRNILKRIGLIMQKNDKKESDDVCLLEYE